MSDSKSIVAIITDTYFLVYTIAEGAAVIICMLYLIIIGREQGPRSSKSSGH